MNPGNIRNFGYRRTRARKPAYKLRRRHRVSGYNGVVMADLEHTLATYVSDMLAIEEQIRTPFSGQVSDSDFEKSPAAGRLVSRLLAQCDAHISALKQCLDSLGGHEISGAKTMVTNIEGWFASAIDRMRKTKIAKALRDDYTALALCTVSYSMLLSTARALGDTRVADLAERHLQDYASSIMEIGEAMPDIVVDDLAETGVPLSGATTEVSRERIAQAWRAGSQTTSGSGL
jgi:ferritin-like metal-binding protein YciE